ncbi:MAG TPA: hypothetical protein P5248_05045, partial [Bacteroidales bacterium]|nr:hypothetical protein [Bacteroidales bacterium]
PGCTQLTEMQCAYRQGHYLGDDTHCHMSSCGPDTGSFSFGLGPIPGGLPVLAQGDGIDSTWYAYPTGWWNMWWYNDPFDSLKWKEIRIIFDLQPLDPGIPSKVVVAANYSTPEWSLVADTSMNHQPPLPGFQGLNEALHIVRDTLVLFPANTMLPPIQHFELVAVVPDYNPEWVSVDIMGNNFLVLAGSIIHECLPPPQPVLGRCCYMHTQGQVACVDNFLSECMALNGQWDPTLQCAQHPCPLPPAMGACCLPNSQCASMDSLSCLLAGGTYHGDSSTCDTVNCGPINNGFFIHMPPAVVMLPSPDTCGGSGQFDDGNGRNGWYYYENYGWWNIWFYDHPFSITRHKIVHVSFDLMFYDLQFPMMLEVALNYSSPYWSSLLHPGPPLPPLTLMQEDNSILRHIFNFPMPIPGTPHHIELCAVIPNFNPEWVSIDVRGNNFRILNGNIRHECIYGPAPGVGRCCYHDPTGNVLCADVYECECQLLGGTWDAALNCQANPCPQPPDTGACCYPDGSCA